MRRAPPEELAGGLLAAPDQVRALHGADAEIGDRGAVGVHGHRPFPDAGPVQVGLVAAHERRGHDLLEQPDGRAHRRPVERDQVAEPLRQVGQQPDAEGRPRAAARRCGRRSRSRSSTARRRRRSSPARRCRVPQRAGLEVERDRQRHAHGVGHELLVGVETEPRVVPGQPQQPAVGDVGGHHHEPVPVLGGLQGRIGARVVAAQVGEGADPELLEFPRASRAASRRRRPRGGSPARRSR